MGTSLLKWFGLMGLLVACPAVADHELEGRDINAGQKSYVEHCASCHGVNLGGEPNWQTPNANGVLPAPPHDETGHTWHHDNELLFEYTKLGGKGALAARGISDFNGGMPAFEDALSDAEIWDILAYIRSTWPERMQQVQDSRNPPH